MDRDITVTEPANDGQRVDFERWLTEARVNESPDGPLNPVLYRDGAPAARR